MVAGLSTAMGSAPASVFARVNPQRSFSQYQQQQVSEQSQAFSAQLGTISDKQAVTSRPASNSVDMLPKQSFSLPLTHSPTLYNRHGQLGGFSSNESASDSSTSSASGILPEEPPQASSIDGIELSEDIDNPAKTASGNEAGLTEKSSQERQNQQREQQIEQQEQEQIRTLAVRDREVRAHEQAHAAVGGSYAGAPTYQYERGPDGVSYAVGGEVKIDVSQASTPEATIEKAQIIRRAALAPAEPSPQDRRVAQEAVKMEAQARSDLAAENAAELAEVIDSQGDIDTSLTKNGFSEEEGINQAQDVQNPLSNTESSAGDVSAINVNADVSSQTEAQSKVYSVHNQVAELYGSNDTDSPFTRQISGSLIQAIA